MFPFSRTQCFFLIRFKAKQKLKMFMGETNFHEIYTQFWFKKKDLIFYILVSYIL